VSESLGIRVGRTSFRLRNPDNAPPDWAAPYVARHTSEEVWLAHPDGRLAGLLPIRLGERCLVCHGDASAVPPDVAARLKEAYPHDEATGFAEGDLRGWFWLEVPAAR